ncbi:hypothetical protein [Mucilaginibacter myungsuensis]|uniref:Uncharacterized protein n=1 Tax=Mucilaginibacter myungsuensis TaxID=649104 RepID=A0A929KT93_9SPHI|nr:hypothetical protein [Mucilaginibacter myungsuensis]MBE9660392.1 hypothetical protein [Mucilaginibacter myungsuensis]MDN3600434.1 hypothetical protein [Mucilaginibacter myungsuensis]
MRSAICTLFEGDYHYGLAALSNSLYAQGFRGTIYAGYKGKLPAWVTDYQNNNDVLCEDGLIVEVAGGLQLHFLQIGSNSHLTNYKPDLLLQLLNGPAKNADSIFYFDPDIVVTTPWSFFEQWVSAGICLCEDVNSPLSEHHPRRDAWRKHYATNAITLQFKNSVYVNGGFIGLEAKDAGFLGNWKNVQDIMADAIGGLNNSVFAGKPLPEGQQERFNPFSRTDQDALNITIETWDGKVSYMGKDAMGFKPGIGVLPHSLGSFKPWHGGYLLRALNGYTPRNVDREYWRSVNTPINLYTRSTISYNSIALKLAAFIGRFYKRG